MTQKYTSKDTSIKTLNRVYKDIRGRYSPGTTILDYGCGKYDLNQIYAQQSKYEWYGYDPYNRTEIENKEAMERFRKESPDVIICSNVLNVIAEDEVIEDIIIKISELADSQTDIFFTIFEGDKSGISGATSKGYQRNAKTRDYLKMLTPYFICECKGNIIKCSERRAA